MEPARKLDQPRAGDSPPQSESKPNITESGREIQDWEIKLGKVIFYVTVAMSLWFFYWLNGIQCPC